MNQQASLIDQLEGLVASKDVSRRAEIFRRVTDLFVVGSGKFSEEQIELFDDVFSKLLDSVERAARAQFGSRLASLSDAPPKIIRNLAFDEAIEVAGPVLLNSERLDNESLIEIAQNHGQEHLLAISGRRVLVEAVTDILVERGNQAVVSSTARNDGAQFSDFGVTALVKKAKDDGSLALCIWSRPDIPRQNLVKLFVEASEAVRSQMAEKEPRKAELIKSAVTEASEQIQTKARAGSHDFAQAKSYVESLHSSGQLNEAQLHAFANEGSFDKVTAALSLMCDLPIGLVERIFAQQQADQILVLAKAIDLSWVTTVTLLLLQAGVNGSSRQRLDQCLASFSKLQPKTAQTALQFYRMRQRATRSVP
jgi:uncharacterized protein (DUF2336 family)